MTEHTKKRKRGLVSWALRRPRAEGGQAMIVMILVLPLLMGIALLAVDVSNGFVHRRSLQNIADSAALAGAEDLVQGLSTATVKADAAAYGSDNGWPLADCADVATATNCYQTPYNGDAGKIEVRVQQSCDAADTTHPHADTFFGRAVNFFTGTNNYGCLKASARAVAGVVHGSPPHISFASLNDSCNNHTLVIRLSGHLTVMDKIYVNSCSGINGGHGDAFDIFGTGGDLKDPTDILVRGGWETHNGDLVCVGQAGSGSGCSTANYVQCPYLTANVTGAGAANPAWQPGCPHVGQPLLNDPFPFLTPPSLSAYPAIQNNACTVANPCYNTSEFTCTDGSVCPYWLDTGLTTADPANVIADQTTGSAAGTVPAFPFNISIGGERMKATANGTKPAGTLPGKQWTASRGQLGTVTSPHSENAFDVVAERRADNVVTLQTAQPHGLSIGDEVRVNLTDNTFDGVYTVTDIPDDETSANPVQFQYVIPGGAKTDLGVAKTTITAVKRVGGLATITLSANVPNTVHVNDPVVVDITTGSTLTQNICPAGYGTCADDSFNEELDDGVTISGISGNTISYQQPGLPDTVDTIHQIGRFDGVATVVTAQNHTFGGNGTVTSGTISYPPDSSFSGTASVTVTAANKVTYTNSGPDVGDNVADTQNVTWVTRWNNVAWLTTNAALTGITDTAPTSRVNVKNVNLSGDSGFNGMVDINANSLTPAKTTFTYPNTGANSPTGASKNITFVARGGGLATLTLDSVSGLDVGETVIVNASNSVFNNGGTPVTITKVDGAKLQIQYELTGGNIANTAATGTVTIVGGQPSTGTVDRLTAGQVTVDASGQACDTSNPANPACTVKPWTDNSATGSFGFNSIATCTGCAIGPVLEIFKVDTTAQTAATPTQPASYLVPAGTSATLQPGVYYGGICIGNPGGQNCGHNVGGSCAASGTPNAGGTVTMSPGVYIMAGGGFYLCGNTKLIGNGVTIYNTRDAQALTANAGKLDQVYINTNSDVTLSGPTSGLYQGLTIWQGKDPANPAAGNLAIAPLTKCDGRSVATTDIVFLKANNGLNGITGTIYAPNPWSLFNDSTSGTTDLAVITGCVFINGATSTFTFTPSLHSGFTSGLVE